MVFRLKGYILLTFLWLFVIFGRIWASWFSATENAPQNIRSRPELLQFCLINVWICNKNRVYYETIEFASSNHTFIGPLFIILWFWFFVISNLVFFSVFYRDINKASMNANCLVQSVKVFLDYVGDYGALERCPVKANGQVTALCAYFGLH